MTVESLAEEILERLRESPAAGEIVLGGYFALRERIDYRATHDLDAWWRSGRSERAMAAIRDAMQAVSRKRRLEVRERAWGETVSFELMRAGKAIFSFQIAVRSVELEPPIESRWAPVLLESLADNLGAKMNALVERGAARDFNDVREAVSRGLVTVSRCWELWARKNPGTDVNAAKAHVLKHLEALEQRRPLEGIEDREQKTTAARARAWIRAELLGLPAQSEDRG